jgi:hypothetical protein
MFALMNEMTVGRIVNPGEAGSKKPVDAPLVFRGTPCTVVPHLPKNFALMCRHDGTVVVWNGDKLCTLSAVQFSAIVLSVAVKLKELQELFPQ